MVNIYFFQEQSHVICKYFFSQYKFPIYDKQLHIIYAVPYSGIVWWVESLANLVNRLQFAKLKPSKVVVTINKLWLIYSFTKHLKRVILPNILPAKLSCYVILCKRFMNTLQVFICTLLCGL